MSILKKKRVINVICLMLIGNYVKGETRPIQAPPSKIYVSSGGTARFEWEYAVGNRNKEFQLMSPKWSFFHFNGTQAVIGYDYALNNWSWTISLASCPSRLLNPTRVSKESNATLVISNVTTADSGIYAIVLLLKRSDPITSKVQLIVTTLPNFSSLFTATKRVIEGKDLRINCSASGIPTPNITWVFLNTEKKEIKGQGIGYAELFIHNITRYQNGTYQCQATNNPNTNPVESQTQISILYKPHISLVNWTVEKDTITLRCLASGRPQPAITWYYSNGNPIRSRYEITKGSNEILLNDTVAPGIFTCNATNEVGWQAHFLNITRSRIYHPSTTSPMKRETKYTTIIPSTIGVTKKGIRNHEEEDAMSLKNILLAVVGVAIPIMITIFLIILLVKKRHKQSKKDESEETAQENGNTSLWNERPPHSTTATYAEVQNAPIYAQIDISSKNQRSQDENIPIYAQVDKSKKRRPGQIIYAELEETKSSAAIQSAILPTPYNTTEYADIKNVGNRGPVENAEPVYETLPDNV